MIAHKNAHKNKKLDLIRDMLASSKNPFIFYDDDPDGMCSFLLLYKFLKRGRGFILKARPSITEQHLRYVEENNPDIIVILDIALVSEEFIKKSGVPVIWIDHHQPQKTKAVYYNPRTEDEENMPTTEVVFRIVKQDMWIAAIGCIGDYYLPRWMPEFKKKNPTLVPQYKTIEDLQYSTPLGDMMRLFAFNLKGDSKEVRIAIKILTRIDNPEELLKNESARARKLYKRYKKVNSTYHKLIETAEREVNEDSILAFIYSESVMSISAEVANRLIYNHPDKIIIVAREKGGEIKGSLRSVKFNLQKAIVESLEGLQGSGGGHEYACGFAIKKEEFLEFVRRLREAYNKSNP